MADPVIADTPVDAAQWRDAMGRFPTGVTVITSWAGDRPVGATYSAFCSVSLDPPLLLICSGRNSRALQPIEETGVFGVNILGRDQQNVAFAFANGEKAAGFADVPYSARSGRPPQIEGAPVFIDCEVEHSYDAGDHRIFVGRGIRVVLPTPSASLLYYQGGFPEFQAG